MSCAIPLNMKVLAMLRQHVVNFDPNSVMKMIDHLGERNSHVKSLLQSAIFTNLSKADLELASPGFGAVLGWWLSVNLLDTATRIKYDDPSWWHPWRFTLSMDMRFDIDYLLQSSSRIDMLLGEEAISSITSLAFTDQWAPVSFRATSGKDFVKPEICFRHEPWCLDSLPIVSFLLNYADIEALRANLSKIQKYFALCAQVITYPGHFGDDDEHHFYFLNVIKPAHTIQFLQKIAQKHRIPPLYHSVAKLIEAIGSKLDPSTFPDLNLSVPTVDWLDTYVASSPTESIPAPAHPDGDSSDQLTMDIFEGCINYRLRPSNNEPSSCPVPRTCLYQHMVAPAFPTWTSAEIIAHPVSPAPSSDHAISANAPSEEPRTRPVQNGYSCSAASLSSLGVRTSSYDSHPTDQNPKPFPSNQPGD
ncbi:hypothetical protein K474DRAFT_939827 [Panus rudis PR-1116 ss-1]|nr:hypothetical protein K474DRAFT_939827 [Panus rudis PR-1116 ss-1]